MIAISSPKFCLEPFEVVLAKIRPFFDCWEVVAEGEHTLSDVKELVKSAITQYDMKITIHAPLSDVNIGSINPKIRELSLYIINETIKFANELDIDVVTIHPGHLSPLAMFCPEKVVDFTKMSISKINRIGIEYGITIAVENLPKSFLTIFTVPDEILNIIENTGVKICFDIGHASTVNCVDAFLQHVKLFANVHLHDNDLKRDLHLPLGDGLIDFKTYINKLKLNYDKNYVIECRSIQEGVKSKNYLLRYIPHSKKI